jgi:hypothetical protein
MSGTEQAAGAGVSMIEFSDAGASQYGLCFFDLDEAGRIVRITDFWPDPYEPPAGRPHLAGRIWPGASGRPVLSRRYRRALTSREASAAGPVPGREE